MHAIEHVCMHAHWSNLHGSCVLYRTPVLMEDKASQIHVLSPIYKRTLDLGTLSYTIRIYICIITVCAFTVHAVYAMYIYIHALHVTQFTHVLHTLWYIYIYVTRVRTRYILHARNRRYTQPSLASPMTVYVYAYMHICMYARTELPARELSFWLGTCMTSLIPLRVALDPTCTDKVVSPSSGPACKTPRTAYTRGPWSLAYRTWRIHARHQRQ